jgi:hypothetical protein
LAPPPATGARTALESKNVTSPEIRMTAVIPSAAAATIVSRNCSVLVSSSPSKTT